MSMRYKFIVLSLLCVVFLTSCTADKGDGFSGSHGENEQKLKVVTTIFPIFDWTREIAGIESKNIELILLSQKGEDMHSYLPTAEDMLKISECDLLICTGGESEKWIEDVLKNNVKHEIPVLKLTDMVGESIQKEEDIREEGHGTNPEEHEAEYDEHVWLSLKNAKICVESIAEGLSTICPVKEKEYRDNALKYIRQLEELDREYQSVVDDSERKTLIFCDRFPFLYMMKDYGIKYYAPFSGCSTETDASFGTVTFMAEKVREEKADSVLVTEGSDRRLAETVLEYSEHEKGQILELDSMQSVSLEDSEQGVTYLSVMEQDLNILREALR